MTGVFSPPRFSRWVIGRLALIALLTALSSFGAETALTIQVQGYANPAFPQQYAPGSSIQLVPTTPVTTGSCQWFHDGVVIPGASNSTLALGPLTATDSGNYQLVVATNGSTQTSSTLTINVLPFPPSPVDLTFTSGLPSDLTAPVVFQGAADGSLMVQGNSYAGMLAYNRVVRLNADGSRDPTVDLNIQYNQVLAVLPDGDLIMRQAPFRIRPDGSTGPFTLPAGFTTSLPLSFAAVQTDGKFLIVQTNLVRLNPDGSVDTSYTPRTRTYAGTYAGISAVHLDSVTRAVVSAGYVDSYGINHAVLYRLNPDGQDDLTFQSVDASRTWFYPRPLSDGSLLVVYYTSNFEGPYTMRLNPDGTFDTAWTYTGLFDLNPYPVSADQNLAVDSTTDRIFYVDNTGTVHRAFVTSTGIVNDPEFYQGQASVRNLQLAPGGKLLAVYGSTQWDGHYTPFLARIRANDVVVPPPVVSISNGFAPNKGATVTLTSTVVSLPPVSYQWLALDGQPLPADTTSPQLVIPNFDVANLGRYQLRVANSSGSVLSNVSVEAYSAELPYLANLSGRAFVGTGDDVAIAGLTTKISGSLTISALLRGAGPALQPYGISDCLTNPVLNLYDANSHLLLNNDTWNNDPNVAPAAAAVGAFPFTAGSTDAAMLCSLNQGNTTLQLSDFTHASGIGLLEVYRTGNDLTNGEFVNLSLRARTGPGEKIATAGFVIVDPQGFGRTVRVLLRVVGPALSQYGVATPLADPILTLYNASGQVIATNDNWSDNPDPTALTAAMTQVGAFALPTGSKDSALLIDLPPGAYSVQATSPNGSSGVVLTEIYVVR